MTNLVAPHGSDVLLPLSVPTDQRTALLEKAKSLPQVMLTSREAGDLIMLGIGGFTPLGGFMGGGLAQCLRVHAPGRWTVLADSHHQVRQSR